MKVGLSLGGGGAKGAYQIGVLKALEEYNLIDSINVISGVSIGAINAYFYLCSNNSQTVYDIWLNGIKRIHLKKNHFQEWIENQGFIVWISLEKWLRFI